MKVIVSGLTAAGKTTLSEKLAHTLDVPYFSASKILRDMLADPADEWSEGLDQRRLDLGLERAVDSTMIDLLHLHPSGIFDSWGLPWYSSEPALRIWIESTPASRLRKCYVSYLERNESKSFEECASILRSKDNLSRTVFQENWGFDIFKDRRPFNMIVDCSALIPDATVEHAKAGAQSTFESVMDALVDRRLIAESHVHSFKDPLSSRLSPVIQWTA